MEKNDQAQRKPNQMSMQHVHRGEHVIPVVDHRAHFERGVGKIDHTLVISWVCVQVGCRSLDAMLSQVRKKLVSLCCVVTRSRRDEQSEIVGLSLVGPTVRRVQEA